MYIHYGSKHFDKELFEPVKNANFPWTKPDKGGLWGSPVDSKCGWKQWNEANHFTGCDESNAFRFTLREDARVLHIRSVTDLQALPKLNGPMKWMKTVCLDFEKIAEDYDAIELHLSEDMSKPWEQGLYYTLYGWDCDSILVLRDVII